MDPQLRIGIDVGCKAHRVGISQPHSSILEEFDVSHTDAGFQDFFRRIHHHKQELDLSGGSSYAGVQWVCTSRIRFLAASSFVLYYGNARDGMRMSTGEKEAQ